jgi:hypothetical protein
MEENGSGLFTGLLIDALNGAAANLVGGATPGSIYAHIDQSLGPWVQRPFFKTNVKRFVSLRKTLPPIEIADLRRIKTHFPTPDYQIQLDPAYERESSTDQLNDPAVPPPDPAKNAVFDTLRRIRQGQSRAAGRRSAHVACRHGVETLRADATGAPLLELGRKETDLSAAVSVAYAHRSPPSVATARLSNARCAGRRRSRRRHPGSAASAWSRTGAK